MNDALPSPSEVLHHVRARTLAPWIHAVFESAARDSPRYQLARALRVDLAAILDRPSLAAQLLYRRLAWTSAFRPWLEAFVRESAPRAWLRSLRPYSPSIRDALVHEWRGEFDRYRDEVQFTANDSVVAVVGERTAAWSLVTGERCSTDATRRHRWSLDFERSKYATTATGIIDKETNERRMVVPSPAFGCWMCVRALHSLDGAIVAGWIDDYEGIVARFERDAGAVVERWQKRLPRSVYSIATSADDTLLAVQTGAQIVLLDAVDGRELGALDAKSHALALSADNERLATLTERSLRVWDLRAIHGVYAWPKDGPHAGASAGRVDAQFSDDSTRVLTGAALCDAETGALVSVLDLDSGGYLEGGPPDRAAGIFGDRVVEAGFSTRAWSVRDGARLPTAKIRPLVHWHTARIAPDGRSLAWMRNGSPQWQIDSIDTGETLRTFAVNNGGAVVLGFAPGGRTLASGHADGCVYLWDPLLVRDASAPRGVVRPSREGDAPNDLCWSIDGQRLVVAFAFELVQIDAMTGAVIARLAYDDAGPIAGEATRRDDGVWLWNASGLNVAALHGWQGFLSRTHDWRVERAPGGWRLVHSATGAETFIASETFPAIDRTGRFVATREDHCAIERCD